MLLELKCVTCGSPDHLILEDSDYGRVLICKNPECDDFNCFIDLHEMVSKYFGTKVTVKEGLTGELTFEIEEGKFHETYDNGTTIKSEKLE